MKHALVTGGAGFIGSHLVDALIEQGVAVKVLDDLSTGRKENIHPKATFIQGSITDKESVKQAVEGTDIIFHLAAQVSVIRAIQDPAETQEINVGGAKNIFTQAEDAGVKKIVLASSCAIYGDRKDAIPESAPARPLNAYAESKLAMEGVAKTSEIETCTLRFFNVYGPRQSPDSAYAAVIPIFIKNALGNKPLTIYGSGEQTRDFVYVKDVVEALLFAQTQTGLFNVCTGKSTTVNGLASLITRNVQSASEINHEPQRDGEILESLGDGTRLADAGFTPKTTFDDGLKKTIDWFRNKYKNI